MPADPPNAWEVLHDDAKSYVSLAAALLGITATFAGKLLSHDQTGRVAVVIGWVALAVSIGLSIYSSGTVFDEIKKATPSTNYRSASAFLNAAIISLGVGVAALAFGAWRTSLERGDPLDSAIAAARSAVAQMTRADKATIIVERLERTPSNEFVIVVQGPTGQKYDVTVVDDGHDVTAVKAP